jgi:hypothetical protein
MGIHYVFSENNVFVSGDLGCAAYWWPTQNNLHFFGGLNLDYFVSKCEASEYGRRPREWDEQTAVEYINSRLDEFKEYYDEEHREVFAKYHPQLKVAAYYGQEDLERVVEDILKSEEVFDDIEELGALCRCGEVYPVRIIAHWLGLKLAVAQLEAVGVA